MVPSFITCSFCLRVLILIILPYSPTLPLFLCSWAYDGYRSSRWNNKTAEPYGWRWRSGDVVGVLLDVDLLEMRFYLNGEDLGTAFLNFTGPEIYPALSLNVRQSVRINFGHYRFQHPPDEVDGKPFKAVWLAACHPKKRVEKVEKVEKVEAVGRSVRRGDSTGGSTPVRDAGMYLGVNVGPGAPLSATDGEGNTRIGGGGGGGSGSMGAGVVAGGVGGGGGTALSPNGGVVGRGGVSVAGSLGGSVGGTVGGTGGLALQLSNIEGRGDAMREIQDRSSLGSGRTRSRQTSSLGMSESEGGVDGEGEDGKEDLEDGEEKGEDMRGGDSRGSRAARRRSSGGSRSSISTGGGGGGGGGGEAEVQVTESEWLSDSAGGENLLEDVTHSNNTVGAEGRVGEESEGRQRRRGGVC